MPAKSPPSGPQLKKTLLSMGQQIRAHRKSIKVSAIAAAEAAGISRVTLNRIERGETSVTMGAYLNVMSALGLELRLIDPNKSKKRETTAPTELNHDTKILLSDYPQLKKIAWQLKKTKTIQPKEALNLYERNWRHIDLNELTNKEREFIEHLKVLMGTRRLLV